MKEIKLTIDGKEVQLTDEQLRSLGIKPEKKRKNPFERVGEDEEYFRIGANGETFSLYDFGGTSDEESVFCVNYFNDGDFAWQVSLHQLLYRKLLKYAYDNECEDTAGWNGENQHWCIYYSNSRKRFDTTWHDLAQYSYVYFSSVKGAQAAIKEVVEPFVKEHPEFVW